ncbi:MAG: phenylalanine--tRNA ligase subunit beta [Bacilli bacterium]|nr:phenylalanine--tRNA ligase subunit beta [Bacilli bacterium]
MISLNWVKDYIDIENEDLKELAVKVTKAGINVEKVISKHIDNLVIGKVIECTDHPDSDHLHVCKVDIGSEITQIVCGAHNVREGIKVIVALPGCVLPGNFEIKKGVIRGIESNGMICALFELGVEEKTDENYAKGIEEIETSLEPGTDANLYLGTDDTLYELDVHKHRNNDCYYHIGFAYEIACILNKKVNLPSVSHNEIEENINDNIKIKIDTDKCPYYTARMVRNVKIGESPEFIKKRLISAGMRPINNVVDISNYVMLEFGQPLHFFDKDKLGNNILVRNANDGEEIVTIDKNNRVLESSDIVITDGVNPVCIAGVMGGLNTEIDENTKNILIESAIFDSVSIRNTSSRLNLKSEASIRYGKGLNFEYTDLALERAIHLLEKYASCDVLSGTIKCDNIDKSIKEVKFMTSEVSNLLGIELTDSDVEIELDRLDFSYRKEEEYFVVTIPRRRLDIDPNVNDIAEEIGRLYGYHNLDSTLPLVPLRRGEYVGDVKIRKEASKRLRSLGLNEAKTYTLTSPEMAKTFRYEDKKQIVLPNPMSYDKSVIRTSVIPSLINVYEYNKARKVEDIFLYEISKTYDSEYNEDVKVAILMKGNYIVNTWKNIKVESDFYLLKGMIENLLDYLGFKNRYAISKEVFPEIHPGISAKIVLDNKELIGILGMVHPSFNKDNILVAELSLTKLYNKSIKSIKYKEASKFPEIVKDVAFIVDKNMDSDEIRTQIKKSGGRLLSDAYVFDVYDNISEGKKSIAYKLTFRDLNRTLTLEEVTEVFNKIISDVEVKCNAILRSN